MRCWFVPPLVLLARAVAWLPQPLLLGLGRAMAWVLWPLLRSRRRIAAINIALCFPELDASAQRSMASASVVNTVIGVLEMLRAWHAPPARLAGAADIEGLEHVQQALARGQGVLLMCGHFTHNELAVRLLSLALQRPVHGIIRRHNNVCLEHWFEAARTRANLPTIAKKDVRGLLRCLLDGQLVLYAADQNFSYQSTFVPFFGIPAATLAVTPDLVRRGRAVLLPFWHQRLPDGRYRLRIEPTWPGWPSGDPATDAARYMGELENVVRECPEQYLWVHRRFKSRPPGAAPIY